MQFKKSYCTIVAALISAFASCSFLQQELLFLVATTSGQAESKPEDEKFIQELQLKSNSNKINITSEMKHSDLMDHTLRGSSVLK